MTRKDIDLLAEAYSLRGSNVSDKVVGNITEKIKGLKRELEFIKQVMKHPEYENNYDPQARLYHQRRLKEIPVLLSKARKKYFGE